MSLREHCPGPLLKVAKLSCMGCVLKAESHVIALSKQVLSTSSTTVGIHTIILLQFSGKNCLFAHFPPYTRKSYQSATLVFCTSMYEHVLVRIGNLHLNVFGSGSTMPRPQFTQIELRCHSYNTYVVYKQENSSALQSCLTHTNLFVVVCKSSRISC